VVLLGEVVWLLGPVQRGDQMTDWHEIGRSSRAKGARFERQVMHAINAIILPGASVARTQRGESQRGVGDLRLTAGSDARLWPFVVEVKYRTKPLELVDLFKERCEFSRWRSELSWPRPALIVMGGARRDTLVVRSTPCGGINIGGGWCLLLWRDFLESWKRETERTKPICLRDPGAVE